MIPSDSTRFQAGARGELDEFRISRDQRASRRVEPGLHGAQPDPPGAAASRGPAALERAGTPFLADARVRRALAHAWSREDAAQAPLSAGRARPWSRARIPPGVPENAPDVAPAAFDPADARPPARRGRLEGRTPAACGARAGRRPRSTLLITAGQAIDGNLAEILRSAYAKVGVELRSCAARLGRSSPSARRRATSTRYLTARFFLPPNFDPYPVLPLEPARRRRARTPASTRTPRPTASWRPRARARDRPREAHRALPAGAPHPRRRTRRRTSSGAPTSTGAFPGASRASRSRRSASSTSCPARSAGARRRRPRGRPPWARPSTASSSSISRGCSRARSAR